MAIQIGKEKLITFQDAHKYIHELTGLTRSAAMIYRWSRQGVKGIKLDSVKVGGSVFTSREAIIRFVDETTQAFKHQCDLFDEPAVEPDGEHQAALARLKSLGVA
jgi:hypothetical protein